MPLLDLQGVADQAIRRGLDALNRFSEGEVYRPLLSGIALNEAAVLERPTIGGTLRDISAWRLPAAASPDLTGIWSLPPEWVSGSVVMEITYSGTINSTNTIRLLTNIKPVKVGEQVPADSSIGFFDVPGPATAGLLLKAQAPQVVTVDASAEFVAWKLENTNTGAYAGEPYIFSVRPLWYPGRG